MKFPLPKAKSVAKGKAGWTQLGLIRVDRPRASNDANVIIAARAIKLKRIVDVPSGTGVGSGSPKGGAELEIAA